MVSEGYSKTTDRSKTETTLTYAHLADALVSHNFAPRGLIRRTLEFLLYYYFYVAAYLMTISILPYFVTQKKVQSPRYKSLMQRNTPGLLFSFLLAVLDSSSSDMSAQFIRSSILRMSS